MDLTSIFIITPRERSSDAETRVVRLSAAAVDFYSRGVVEAYSMSDG